MMDSISGPGLVLRRVRHMDNDVKLTILLREFGKVMAVSRGGQKQLSKLKAIQEPFSEADFQMFVPPHGANGRLSGGRLVDSHENLRQSYDAFMIGSRCCEVVDVLLPYRAPSPDVYDILRASLRSLQNSALPPLHEWVLFIVRILKVLGHGDVSEQASRLLADSPLDYCVEFVEAELERILPWRLKSAVEVQ